MKAFLLLRVPATWSGAIPARRPNFGSNPTVVGEADDVVEAAKLIEGLQRGDLRHHYYGLELRLIGGPGEAIAEVVPAPRPKAVQTTSRSGR